MRLLLCLTIFLVLNECNSEICAKKICVEKCCPYKYYMTKKDKCENNVTKIENISTVPVYDSDLNAIGVLDKYMGVSISDKFGTNKASYINAKKYYQNFTLFENGTMRMIRKKKGNIELFEASAYCMDYQVSINNTVSANVSVRFENVPNKPDKTKEAMKYGLPVSCLFLLLVLVVYCLLPDLRTLGGLVLMGYVASLMISYMMLFAIHIGAEQFNGGACITMTLITYFFFLASFCWMNVMSFDIWWTFRGYAKARPINRRGENHKFKMYCLYAFGVPIAMTVFMAIVNANAKKWQGMVTPGVPAHRCFLQGDAQFYYLYVPLLILMICNWMFFLMTAFNIYRLSRGTNMLKSKDSNATGGRAVRNGHKQRFIMYLKLSTMMGLSWILEVVSAQCPELGVWYITDAYNILMGVVIFLIFVCKRKIFAMLKTRYAREKLGPPQTSTRSTLESSVSASTPLQSRQMQTFSIQP